MTPAPMDRPDPRPIKQPPHLPPLQTYDLKLAPLIVIGGKIKKVVLTDNRAGLGTTCSPPPPNDLTARTRGTSL